MDGSVNSNEFLQTSHPSEPQNRPFLSSKRQARILDPVVPPAAGFTPAARVKWFSHSESGKSVELIVEKNPPLSPLSTEITNRFKSLNDHLDIMPAAQSVWVYERSILTWPEDDLHQPGPRTAALERHSCQQEQA